MEVKEVTINFKFNNGDVLTRHITALSLGTVLNDKPEVIFANVNNASVEIASALQKHLAQPTLFDDEEGGENMDTAHTERLAFLAEKEAAGSLDENEKVELEQLRKLEADSAQPAGESQPAASESTAAEEGSEAAESEAAEASSDAEAKAEGEASEAETTAQAEGEAAAAGAEAEAAADEGEAQA